MHFFAKINRSYYVKPLRFNWAVFFIEYKTFNGPLDKLIFIKNF